MRTGLLELQQPNLAIGQKNSILGGVGKTSFSQIKHLLMHKGRYLLTVFGRQEIVQMLWTSLFGGKRVIGASSNFGLPRLDRQFFYDY